MVNDSRRSFIKKSAVVGAGAAAISTTPNVFASIEKALSIPANRKHGSIKDVEHVVILMQENRSFDHYFGTMPGVRGFADRFPLRQPNGDFVWNQHNPNPDEVSTFKKTLLPWYFNTSKNIGYEFFAGTPHFFNNAQYANAHGKMDQWLPNKTDRTMGYFTEKEVPFQFALANAFTLCDAYYCSTQTGTNPNRVVHWSGTNDPHAKKNGPVINNNHENFYTPDEIENGYKWTTYPERLQQAGISWRLVQNINNNYTDNPLAGFKTFRDAHHNNPSAPFYLNGIGTEIQPSIETFRELYNSEEGLPKVTWIVTENDLSEHPGCSTPTLGAAYTSEVLDILTSDPSIWAKTVFIVNFDENDGLFDHMPPPSVPHKTPDNKVYGKTNISTHNEYYYDTDYSKTEENVDDFVNNASHGLGPRVPCYVISPWSIGGNINSQVFDHTSVLRFLEKVTGVEEPNISTWRREICGDLTSCFDFEKRNDAIDIPHGKSESQAHQLKAAAEKEHEKHSTKPGHEREYGYDESGKRTKPQMSLVGLPVVTQNGSRPSCQLPYAPKVDIHFKSDAVMFEFANQGKQGIVYQTYNYLAHNEPQQDKFLAPENSPYDMTMPRQYSVASKGANKLEPTVSDKWTFGDHRDFDLMTFGPNGFIRRVKGLTSEHREMPIVSIVHKESRAGHATPHLSIKIENHSKQTQVITITDNIYGKDPVEFKIKAGKVEHIAYKTCKHCWYDLSITADNCEYFSLQAAGRIEMNHKHNFKAVTDPEMGNFSCDNELNSLIS
ncbi:phosphocholine-specific phospholipase C [Photobacterium angustum]|uniref:phosphocholine-specific phospholipase C n=1 Tax=Photobacterium angustum TaxID=661 RepID=UPI0005DEB9D3|nr:phospholipase C, phosphocholine-specific [Photobacterium angustum]KJF93759.1 phospholipase C [Photobacterium angustum]PSW82172.1 phospholipase C, phosphocholine-specific [Photobacterium angustum]